MELAIPLVALGGLYVVSNNSNNNNTNNQNVTREGFTKLESKNRQYNNVNNANSKPLVKKVTFAPSESNNNEKVLQSNYDSKTKYFDGSLNNNNTNSNNKQIQSLTGEPINVEQFSHNNMQPYFGAKVRGMTVDSKITEGILDNMNGSGSQTIRKTEQAPLFKPQENMQHSNGAPNMSDFYQSRVNPSQKIANVKPFESQMVGPGLNKGFEKSGTGGFNSGMDAREVWQPKTVDDLRVTTNPKESYSLKNHQGPATYYIKERGNQAKVEKYAPDTYYESGSDRWFTTTGVEKKQTTRSGHIQKNIQRNDKMNNYNGTPGSSVEKKTYNATAYRPSTRNTYNSVPFTPVNATGKTEIMKPNYDMLDNNRAQTCENQNLFGFVSNTLQAAITPIVDVLKPSRKENAIGNVRGCGDVQVSVPANYIQENQQAPALTNRQMYSNSLEHYNVQNQGNGGYETSEHHPVFSNRNETSVHYTGNSANTNSGVALYNAAYKQTNNESKQKVSVARTNPGNTQVFVPNQNISVGKYEADRNNNRMWVPNNTSYSTPSLQTHGIMDMPQGHKSDSSRIQPDLLDAFKKNPFTHSLHSVA